MKTAYFLSALLGLITSCDQKKESQSNENSTDHTPAKTSPSQNNSQASPHPAISKTPELPQPPPSSEKPKLPALTPEMIGEMSIEELVDTLNILIQNSAPEESLIKATVQKIAKTDNLQLWSWFTNHRELLTPELLDAVASSAAQGTYEKKDYDGAHGWLHQSTDKRKFSRLAGRIYSAQRAYYEQLAGADPEAFVKKILTERGTHDDHWLVTGFIVWGTNAPQDAQQWLKKNNETLTYPQIKENCSPD